MNRFYERFLTTGEIPWDMVDERVEVHDHDTPDQGAYLGRGGVERWLQEWSEAWSDWEFEPEEFIDAGNAVIVVIRMRRERAAVSSLIARTQSSIASAKTRSSAPTTTTANSRPSKSPASLPRGPMPFDYEGFARMKSPLPHRARTERTIDDAHYRSGHQASPTQR